MPTRKPTDDSRPRDRWGRFIPIDDEDSLDELDDDSEETDPDSDDDDDDDEFED